MTPVPIQQLIEQRQIQWLRETYGITLTELYEAPSSARIEVLAAWVRYWREECTQGRGIQTEAEPGKLTRGSRRLA